MIPTYPAKSGAVHRIQVLLVDDDELVLRAVRAYFARHTFTYRTIAVHSGREAMRVLECDPIDVIVADVKMPGMSGCELHTAVSERWPALAEAFIFVSGGMDAADAAYVESTGCTAFDKPVPLPKLAERIEQVFAARSSKATRTRSA